ncbi:GPR1/FUN34/yaaH family-domain-containing protein [Sparassis latifolia]|uniref:Meiotically up-regulated gene 86 protein n=1 Tax=Sparassis crispa TaxID=139825 RepID=A0A401GDC9_9APHY|nr:Meiotically up-regulated gene 86 protein [Sparassis crispa]GBE80167.1 Meiotically up-regulated gene 86 protein [Sparassis crispa]
MSEKSGAMHATDSEHGVPHSIINAPPPVVEAYKHSYADPAPLGMLAYGTVFFCSSLLTLHAGGVQSANLVLVFAVFFGGISQTLVGMWCMFLGDTFSATVFGAYGGFNFSYGALYLPQIGLAAAYSVDGVVTEEFSHAIGIYLAIWDAITLLFFIGALRTTLPVCATLGFTVLALTCLSANSFTGNPHLGTAGGAFGLCATAGAYYGALSGIYTRASTFKAIRLPPVVLAYQNV